jgi:hypothetical protein
LIEAKGATSSRPGSERFDLGFSPTQVFDRVAKGAYTAMELRGRKKDGECIALAFPSSPMFENYVGRISRTLKDLDIVVLWVDPDRKVRWER